MTELRFGASARKTCGQTIDRVRVSAVKSQSDHCGNLWLNAVVRVSAVKSTSDLPQITYMSADFSVRADDLSAGSMGLADQRSYEVGAPHI